MFQCSFQSKLVVLGIANLHLIPQPQIPQTQKSCSASPQVCDRFAVNFCTSATANEHFDSANLDRKIYCSIFSSVIQSLMLNIKKKNKTAERKIISPWTRHSSTWLAQW